MIDDLKTWRPVLHALEIEQPTDQFAFEIIRERRIRAVLIGPVMLDPGIEARCFSALLKPSWCGFVRLNAACELLEILSGRNKIGTPQELVAVIVRDTFRHP